MSFQSLDPYIYQKSWLHEINTKIKIICFLAFMVLSSITNSIFFASSLLFISILLLYSSKIPIYKFVEKIKYPLFLIVGMIFSIYIFSFHIIENIEFFYKNLYILFVRSTASLFFIISFFGTTKLELITCSLIDFHVPNTIVQIFIFSYRFVFVLINELAKLFQILTIKGFELKLNTRNLSIISNLIGILFIKSYEKSDYVYYSMISKGYSGEIKIIHINKIELKDYMFLFFTLLYIFIYIIFIYIRLYIK